MAGALIVTAELAPARFRLARRPAARPLPAERNRVPAHLTMFHALPPSAEREVRARLSELANAPPPRARIEGLMDLGGGVAFRIVSDDLGPIRDRAWLSMLRGLLGAQDAGGWRPHVTIQNKVPPRTARALLSDAATRTSSRGRWQSAGSACTAISTGRGSRSRSIRSAR